MSETYGVIWHDGRALRAGKLELDPFAISLGGIGADGEDLAVEVPLCDVASVRLARGATDRLDSRPTLVLEQLDGSTLRVAGVAETGIVSELAEKLAALIPVRAPSAA